MKYTEERNSYPSDKRYKRNKPVVVEHKYIGKFPVKDMNKWLKWKSYKNESIANDAVYNLNRKYKCSFIFRIRYK